MLTVRSLHPLSAGLIALVSLLAVGCGGADSERSDSADLDADYYSMQTELTTSDGGCEQGAVTECKIYLGEHGDLNNCIFGLAVCTQGEWSDCVDEQTMTDNPELYADLITDGEED